MRSIGRASLASLLTMVFCLSGAPELIAAEQSQKFAAIEIGGSNVKFVRVDVQQREGEVRLVEAGDSKVANPGLAADLGATGKFDPQAIERTAKSVGELFEQLTHKHGVPADHVAIAGSSGLVEAKNREQLEAAIRKATSRKMDFITAADEVRFTLLGVVPDAERFAATLVDVGSSNTKWGHLKPDDRQPPYSLVSADIPWGSKSLSGAISEEVGEFAEARAFMQQAQAARKRIASELHKQAAAAKIQVQDKVYLSGGAVWAMVTLVKPASAEQEYVRLTADDFEQYQRRLMPDADALFKVDLESVKDARVRTAAADELATVRKVFRPEQIVAGGQILLAFVDAFAWDDPQREVYFARSGYKAWLKGYLKEFVLAQVAESDG